MLGNNTNSLEFHFQPRSIYLTGSKCITKPLLQAVTAAASFTCFCPTIHCNDNSFPKQVVVVVVSGHGPQWQQQQQRYYSGGVTRVYKAIRRDVCMTTKTSRVTNPTRPDQSSEAAIINLISEWHTTLRGGFNLKAIKIKRHFYNLHQTPTTRGQRGIRPSANHHPPTDQPTNQPTSRPTVEHAASLAVQEN